MANHVVGMRGSWNISVGGSRGWVQSGGGEGGG